MDSIISRPASHDPLNTPSGVADADRSTAREATGKERAMTCGAGRSSGIMTMAAIAVTVVVISGLSFGWSGWLTASLGGISLLFLLPCLAMCVGMIWMMMRGGNSQSSKELNRDRRP